MRSADQSIDGKSIPAEKAGRERVFTLPSQMRFVLVILNFAVQFIPLWLMVTTGQGWLIFITAGTLLGLVPALDHILAKRKYRLDIDVDDKTFRQLQVLQAVFLMANFVAVIVVATSGAVPLWASFFAVITIGIINVHVPVLAHEFGHKAGRTSHMMSNIVCAIAGMGYFMPQHVLGHHVKVATPEDCASARFGESSFRFIVGSFWPEVKGGWTLEAERLRKRGGKVWSLQNDVIVSYAFAILFAGILIAVLGWMALPWIMLHHLFAWFSLMLNDYIQHYGLQRELLPNGRREPVTPMHSWNSDSPLCNLMVFNVQHHSYHHARPMEAYENLKAIPEAPTCPSGYFGMMVLALVPPWWRSVMDPKVIDVAKGRRERIHVGSVGEKRLAKLLARYEETEITGKALA